MPSLEVLAEQARMVRNQIEALEQATREQIKAGAMTEFSSAREYCRAAEHLMSMVFAAFVNAHQEQVAVEKRRQITAAERAQLDQVNGRA